MLPTCDEDFAVGEYDTVVEGAGVCHRVDGVDSGHGFGGANGNDVRVGCAVGVFDEVSINGFNCTRSWGREGRLSRKEHPDPYDRNGKEGMYILV